MSFSPSNNHVYRCFNCAFDSDFELSLYSVETGQQLFPSASLLLGVQIRTILVLCDQQYSSLVLSFSFIKNLRGTKRR
jgi:hypothetical protein